jgi:hypothetical protein
MGMVTRLLALSPNYNSYGIGHSRLAVGMQARWNGAERGNLVRPSSFDVA